MSDYKSHGGKPIEFCGDQEGWIAVGSLSSDSPDSPCFPHVVLLGMGLGESGKEHPSNIAAMLTIDQATDLCGRLTAAMIVDRPAPTTATASGLDLEAIERATSGVTMSDALAAHAHAPALIADVRALRAKLAEVRELIDSTEHESSCTIGPYGPGQNGADCNCLVGTIAAKLEAL